MLLPDPQLLELIAGQQRRDRRREAETWRLLHQTGIDQQDWLARSEHNMNAVKPVYEPVMEGSANRARVGRNRSRDKPGVGRCTHADVDHALNQDGYNCDQPEPSVQREPTPGNRIIEYCINCLCAAYARLMQLARAEGYREGHAEAAKNRRVLLLASMVSILAVTMLAGSYFLWPWQTEEAAINRIYAEVSPAVAMIGVESAGVTGSGVVFDRNGHVLTNYHVIEKAQGDQDIVVQLLGLDHVPSRLIGYDTATDLAVLKVDVPPDHLTVANFGDARRVQVGDVAVAIGNPFRLSNSLTVGHISAVGRRLLSTDRYAPDLEGVLQTDAAINPGNSGGPLLNASGQVIGINTRIESPVSGSVGLGFAIPSDTALEVARELIVHGHVRRPFLGVAGRPIDATLASEMGFPMDQGLLVQEIFPNSPAMQIGLHTSDRFVQTTNRIVKTGGDVILSVDGQAVHSQSDLNHLVAQHAIGESVQLEILRNGSRMMIKARLTERPRVSLGATLSTRPHSTDGE